MKKIIALSSLVLGTIFLAGCGLQQTSQTQPTAPAPVVQQPSATQSPATQVSPTDENANLITYTNPTFQYSINYPATWTEKQSKVFESGLSEDKKNMAIEFYNENTLILRILADYRTKGGDPSLSSLAAEIPAPMDKTTVSGVATYKVGNLDGYRRLVVVSDPAFQGLEYITKDSKYIYHIVTFEKNESLEITNILKTFFAK